MQGKIGKNGTQLVLTAYFLQLIYPGFNLLIVLIH